MSASAEPLSYPVETGGKLWRLSLVSAGLLVITVLAIGATVWNLHTQALSDARRDIDNLATILSHQTNRSLLAADLVLQEIKENVARLDIASPDEFKAAVGHFGMHRRLQDLQTRLTVATSIVLIGSDGRLANFSRQWPIPDLDLSDRDYFQHLRNANDGKAYISAPVANRTTGTMTIYVALRINDPNQKFRGVVAAALEVRSFEDLFGSISLSRDESFLLLRTDGTVLIRYPDPNRRSGEKMPADSEWYDVVFKGGGFYESPGYFDGRSRLVSVRPLKAYPVVFNASIGEHAVLSIWRRQALSIGLGTLCALACSAMLLIAAARQFRKLRTSEASFAYLSQHDPLTQLANRVMFTERLEEALASTKKQGTGLAVMYLDLDHFKDVNDSLGHAAGDQVLRTAAARMLGVVRSGDTLARLGGDEFGIIGLSIGAAADVENLAQRLLSVLGDPYVLAGQNITVGASIGIALYPDHGTSAEMLITHADEALYRAKWAGRNIYRLYSEAGSHVSRHRSSAVDTVEIRSASAA